MAVRSLGEAASTDLIQALPLSRLEQAVGLAIGFEPAIARHPAISPTPSSSPREALLAAIARSMAGGRSYVSFSGGRDSSAVLATATLAARREGLADPVPLTLRFPGISSTNESAWQEMVVDHLGLSQWKVIEVADELDLLGPIARRTLLDHGLLWPVNAYFHVPLLEQARGAVLMTGFDGDGVFGTWRWARAQGVLGRRVRPTKRDALRVSLALLPPAARQPVIRSPLLGSAPWLTRGGQRALALADRHHAAAEPRRWDQRIAYYVRSRFVSLTVHSMGALGQAYGVQVVHPYLDREFLGSLARAGGRWGYGDRTETMRAVFAGDLPEEVLSRRGKAEFGRALWRSEAREFVAGWDGAGLDTELVDPERLRRAWAEPSPLFGAGTLLHQLWLASRSP